MAKRVLWLGDPDSIVPEPVAVVTRRTGPMPEDRPGRSADVFSDAEIAAAERRQAIDTVDLPPEPSPAPRPFWRRILDMFRL